jgi:hypothetical protein
MSVHKNLYVKSELFTNRVDGTDFTTADWAFLGTVDQNLAKTDNVQFQSVTLTNGSAVTKIETGLYLGSNYTLVLPPDGGAAGQVLQTDGTGVLTWTSSNSFDQSLNTTDSPQFVDLTLTGNLTVSGTTTLIETTNSEIKDNIILLNNGEVGAGVAGGTGTSGFEVERGTETNVLFLFDETTDKWTVGSTGAIGTTRFIVAELAEASQTAGAIPGYDANGRLAEASGLTPGEVAQLQNIDSTVISAAQWVHVSNMDQDVTATANVSFNDLTVNGSLTLLGPLAQSVSALLTADPAPVTEQINLFDTSGGAVTCTLPDNAASSGQSFIVYLKVAGSALTITRAGTDTIEGDTTLVLDSAGQHTELLSLGDGTWIVR